MAGELVTGGLAGISADWLVTGGLSGEDMVPATGTYGELVSHGLTGLAAGWLVTDGLTGAMPAPKYDIREALNVYLRSDQQLQDIVGQRIRPGVFSQKDLLPAITYAITANEPVNHLAGFSGPMQARAQFDFWSRYINECTAAKTRTFALLNALIGGTLLGINIDFVWNTAEVDLHEFPDDGTDRVLYHIACDYLIQYRA